MSTLFHLQRARSRSARSTFLRDLKRRRELSADAMEGPSKHQPQSTNSAGVHQTCPIIDATEPLVAKKQQSAASQTEPVAEQPSGVDGAASTPNAKASHISFTAWNHAKTLDIHTYHRGREGLELRDLTRGEWRCDVPATDTNHGRDDAEPLTATVTIQFPVHRQQTKALDQGDGSLYFKETISWDLADPETPLPPVFAARIAEQYGLTLKEMLELTESIQNQLYTFVSDRAAYSVAFPIRDTFGQQRETAASNIFSLYGDALGPFRPGFVIPKRQTKPRTTRQTSAARTALVTHANPSSTSSRPEPKSKTAERTAKPTVAVEAEYLEEIKRRLLNESLQSCREEVVKGPLKIVVGNRCHICRSENNLVAQFPCGATNHSLCDGHMMQFHGMSTLSAESCRLDFCPICSLTCPCSWCTKRLEHLGALFKQRCQDQAKPAAQTLYDALLEDSRECERQAEVSFLQRRIKFGMVRVAEKVPLSKFPKETFAGQDLCPGSPLDFMTVYSAAGVLTLSEDKLAADDATQRCQLKVPSPTEPTIGGGNEASSTLRGLTSVEDGSVDHCIVCKDCGDLLCCDACPRAYHARCIDDKDVPSGNGWECPACRREIAGIPEENLEPDKYIDLITAAFDGKVDFKKHKIAAELKALSMIYSMLEYLMSYDFGYMFRVPVNEDEVPLYSAVVKEPMDLGTISKKILDGGYDTHIREETLENVVVTALNDISLVWHNCFLFNSPGSAIFRMAEVQRAAADRIRENSIDGYLSSDVKSAARDYRISSDILRRQLLQTTRSTRDDKKAKREINVAPRDSAKGRTVAVLDPSTGRIVKMYVTVSSAIAAVDVFLQLGYSCEWELTKGKNHGQVIRRIIKESSTHVEYRLFGYRWVHLDELKAGAVRFESAPPISPSAIAKERVPSGIGIEPAPEGPQSELGKPSGGGERFIEDGDFAVIKTDAESGAVLSRFATVDTAYRDWLASVKAGQHETPTETITSFEVFTTYYLNGNHNMGGVTWRTTPTKGPDLLDEYRIAEESKALHRPRPDAPDDRQMAPVMMEENGDSGIGALLPPI